MHNVVKRNKKPFHSNNFTDNTNSIKIRSDFHLSIFRIFFMNTLFVTALEMKVKNHDIVTEKCVLNQILKWCQFHGFRGW